MQKSIFFAGFLLISVVTTTQVWAFPNGKIAPPPNDECAGAISLTVNADLSCGTVLNATTIDATASGIATTGCGSATADDDVWFSFVATGTNHWVQITGATTNMVLQVFSGTCGALNLVVCNNPFKSNVDQPLYGLVIGQTYYLRVFTRLNSVYSNFTICVGTFPPPPLNDECANAITLTVNADLNCGTVLNSTTIGGTPSNPTVPGCSGTADDDVWYTFVATAQSHRIKISGGTTGMVLQVFSGTCGSFTTLACNEQLGGNVEQQVNDLTIGETYYMRVYTRLNLVYSNFTICVGAPPPPPPNDECAGAIALTVNPDLNCGTVLNTTTAGGLPSNPPVSGCSGTADDDVWYKFVATAQSQRIKISGGTAGMVLQVLSGTCGNFTTLACNEQLGGNVEQQVNDLTPGNTYYLRVYTRLNLLYSDFTLCIGSPPPPPVNDECAGAIALTVNPDLGCSTVLNTTTSGGTPSNPTVSGCSGSPDDDVWYSFVATAQSQRIKISGGTAGMVLQVFSGTCGNFTTLACNEQLGGNVEQQVYGLTPGTTYYLRVYTRLNLLYSDFTLCIGTPPPPPVNDECANAIALTVNPDLFCADTLNATTSGGLPSTPAISGCFGSADDDVWFSFVATGPTQRVKVYGPTQSLVLQSFSGACGSLFSLACNTTYPGTGPLEHQITGLTPGQTYYIRVYTYLNLVYSDFTICITTVVPPPANDDCANATSLTVNANLSCASTLNATTSGGLPTSPTVNTCYGSADDDVWFSFVATGPSHRVKVSGATKSMVIQSFSGTCGSLTSLACNTAYPSIGTVEHQLNGLTAGLTYYVRVFTYQNLVSSDFTICIGTPPPPPVNDACANATNLTVNPNLTCTNTLNATTAGALQSLPACTGAASDDDVWFTFTALADSQTVQLSAATEPMVMQIFSGDCNNLSSLFCDYGAGGAITRKLTSLSAGQTYFVRVYTANNLVYSDFTLCVSTPTLDSAHAAVHVFLQGPYVSGPMLMHDSLRVKGLIPLHEPYTGLPNFTHVNGGGEQTTPAVLAVTGSNAIVDWVFLELRNANSPTQVMATRAALLQRDGDVVDVDGVSPVRFYALAGQSYYLAVRHRNHLGVQLGAAKLYPSGVDVETDFRSLPPEGFYDYNGQNAAQKVVGGKYVLWAGNGRIDYQLKYNGSVNDRNAVLSVVGLATPNNTVPGYLPTDYNLDGLVKYNGSANDRNVLLGNVGIATPSAILDDQIAR